MEEGTDPPHNMKYKPGVRALETPWIPKGCSKCKKENRHALKGTRCF